MHRSWATVCKTVRPMLSDRCLSCLSVTSVYCGQTAGWIKMKLGVELGLDPGHIVLDGDLTPLPQRGTTPNVRPYLVWMDQGTTWYGSTLWPRPHCVTGYTWGSSSPKRGTSPNFSVHLHCAQTMAHLSYC